MKPPEAPDFVDGNPPPAVLLRLHGMKKRANFLAAARARKMVTPGFILQARKGDGDVLRVGFTASKKVGNAVARNRAKRRLRALAQAVLPLKGRAGWDYVLIGRRDVTASRDFLEMQAELNKALEKLHKSR